MIILFLLTFSACWPLSGGVGLTNEGFHLSTRSRDIAALTVLPELTPGQPPESLVADQKVFQGNTPKPAASTITGVTLFVLVCLSFFALSPVYSKHGLAGFGTAAFYLASLGCVTALVKVVFLGGLPYPYTITAIHMLCTSLVASAYDRPKLEDALKVIPVSMLTTGVLGLSNAALLYGGVAFVTMVGTATPVTTYALELFTSRKSLDPLELMAVLVVSAGGLMCVRGEPNFSMPALLFAWSATVCRSVRVIWQADLLSVSLPPAQLTAWMSFWAALFLLPLIAHTEGLSFVRNFPEATLQAKVVLALSCCAAAVLNLSATLTVKLLGTLLQNIIGSLQLVMVLATAVVCLHEQVNSVQWAGVLLISSSTMFMKLAGEYSLLRLMPSRFKAKEEPATGQERGQQA